MSKKSQFRRGPTLRIPLAPIKVPRHLKRFNTIVIVKIYFTQILQINEYFLGVDIVIESHIIGPARFS